ncbi:hypothetical protein BDV96DRAFT_217787 [Lophiotrema nucula]|uniref:Uncharacterized protein n=1 Tax=Lophiotrema nucula TaxID=690887 RepID=A0A6A5ZPP3_9PLEO|nr:hypothetical protein BDV96DRAFT_217787 [Lophiotrema nucula]
MGSRCRCRMMAKPARPNHIMFQRHQPRRGPMLHKIVIQLAPASPTALSTAIMQPNQNPLGASTPRARLPSPSLSEADDCRKRRTPHDDWMIEERKAHVRHVKALGRARAMEEQIFKLHRREKEPPFDFLKVYIPWGSPPFNASPREEAEEADFGSVDDWDNGEEHS